MSERRRFFSSWFDDPPSRSDRILSFVVIGGFLLSLVLLGGALIFQG